MRLFASLGMLTPVDTGLLTPVDTGQSEFVLTSLRVTVTRFSAVFMSKTVLAWYRSLMHVESSTMLDRIPFEWPLHGIDSFREDITYNCQR